MLRKGGNPTRALIPLIVQGARRGCDRTSVQRHRAALEYSVVVNSFIESEALTSLKAAERPRLCSPHKAALHLHFACVSEREARVAHRCKTLPGLCSASLPQFIFLGFLRPDPLSVRITHFCMSVRKPVCVFSFESNPPSHQKRTGCHVWGSPLFVLCRKQDAQTEESPSAGDGAPAETAEVYLESYGGV